jgi:peroxiredoxin
MSRLLVGALFAAVLFASGVAHADLKAGDRAIDFQKTAVGGRVVKLSALRGKVVLVDFWASWCEPCKKELPLLSGLVPRLRSHGVEIIAVNIDDDRGHAEQFVKEHHLSLTVVEDSDKRIVGEYGPPKMPTSFVVDKKGVVRAVNAGFEEGDQAKLEKQLEKLAAD